MSEQEIRLTSDGSPTLLSKRFGVTYHSIHGAIQESEHVFIDAGFRYFSMQQALSILEIGLGTGLNAYMTYLENKKTCKQISYTGIEAFPIGNEQLAALNYPQLLNEEKTADIFEQMHHCPFDQPVQLANNFTFEKRLMKFEELEDQETYDLIYFDAFGPTSQPELWREELLQKMHNALLPGGVLVTYCAKGVVKRTLKAIGFSIEALPGPPGKREMTRAKK